MDALLLLAPTAASIGYSGRGDFAMAPDGRLTRRGEREVVPFVYAGAAILTPAFLAGVPHRPLPRCRRCSTAHARPGACCGLRLEGVWMHVGTPRRSRRRKRRSWRAWREPARRLSASGRNSMDAAAHRQDAAPTQLVDRARAGTQHPTPMKKIQVGATT